MVTEQIKKLTFFGPFQVVLYAHEGNFKKSQKNAIFCLKWYCRSYFAG